MWNAPPTHAVACLFLIQTIHLIVHSRCFEDDPSTKMIPGRIAYKHKIRSVDQAGKATSTRVVNRTTHDSIL